MTEDDDEPNWIDYVLGFISGAAIGYGLYKLLTGGKEHYRCPHCQNVFEGKPTICPYCGSRFRW